MNTQVVDINDDDLRKITQLALATGHSIEEMASVLASKAIQQQTNRSAKLYSLTPNTLQTAS